ncbi:Nn.00g021530.m01.CDS01 [Neocucurbitaria sp. VM-36]
MQLQVCPLQLHDFDELVAHAASYPPGEDLVGPPTPICCAVTTREEAEARLAFHFNKQRNRFTGDPTVRYMKVVDNANNKSIISIARWHFYPTGYNFDTEIHWETHNPNPGQPIPRGFNIPLHNHILTTRDASRSSWTKANSPCWILMHMVTHPSHRGKGAAGMLIRWGIEQAEKDQVPAYLEAGVMGKPAYERYGFVQIGDLLEVDLKEFGVDTVFTMCKMAYFPRKKS